MGHNVHFWTKQVYLFVPECLLVGPKNQVVGPQKRIDFGPDKYRVLLVVRREKTNAKQISKLHFHVVLCKSTSTGHDFRRTRSSTRLLQPANGIFAQTPCLQSQPYATISNSCVRRVLVDMPLAWWSMAFLDGNYQLVRSSCACENLPLRWVVHGFSRTAL